MYAIILLLLFPILSITFQDLSYIILHIHIEVTKHATFDSFSNESLYIEYPFPKNLLGDISFTRHRCNYVCSICNCPAIHRDYNRPLIVARFDLEAATN